MNHDFPTVVTFFPFQRKRNLLKSSQRIYERKLAYKFPESHFFFSSICPVQLTQEHLM